MNRIVSHFAEQKKPLGEGAEGGYEKPGLITLAFQFLLERGGPGQTAPWWIRPWDLAYTGYLPSLGPQSFPLYVPIRRRTGRLSSLVIQCGSRPPLNRFANSLANTITPFERGNFLPQWLEYHFIRAIKSPIEGASTERGEGFTCWKIK